MQATVSRQQRLPILAVAAVIASVAITEPAVAQALEPVVRASTILRDSVVGICLLLLTAAWGMAGYKVAFQGANFRDIAGNIIGGAIAGSAGAMAALFITA